MSDQQDIHDDEALAAEYVLRLLDADAGRAFELRLQSEPDLRALVHFWEAEFATLTTELPEEVPPASVKAKLLAELEGTGTQSQRRWGWGWLVWPALAALAVAAFLAFSPLVRGPAFDPSHYASLISQDGAVHIEAGYAPSGNLLKVTPEKGAPAPGRDFELWVIGPDAAAPVSLGVITADQDSVLTITPDIATLIDGGTLAISDEPAGGSPTGAPTGDILAIAKFSAAKTSQPG